MKQRKKIDAAYQIIVTLRCNVKCKWCDQGLDVVSWDHVDTDLTEQEVRVAGLLLERHGIRPVKLRLTGGEPLLHSDLESVARAASETWSYAPVIRAYTYKRKSKRDGVLFMTGEHREKHPFRVSPFDLGIEPEEGIHRPCRSQARCGRVFQKFGFSFCAFAGHLGLLLGVDCYEPYPVLIGSPSICQHCLFSLGDRGRLRIFEKIKEGKIPEPSKTYREGIEQWLDDPPRPETFFERLPKEVLVKLGKER
jgi:hypothetical protein